jgi:uncharacterized protein
MRASVLLILVSCIGVASAGWGRADRTPSEANRLSGESSPYLRQHAHNPVDWYPWGEDAFARARRESKPIFLSIGYSTCHWCHVMERESFADPEIARLLNEHFINIKVDREERPDVDRVHMMFVQAATGQGGWPLNVWLTPELKPFFGGTYFGPVSRPGHPAFKSVILRLAGLWAEQRERLLDQADRMHQALAQDLAVAGDQEVNVEALRMQALRAIDASFDATNGGFEAGEKFPDPSIHEFLLDVAVTAADPEQRAKAAWMTLTTLRAMADGGLYDQLGGGFHRYSVDPAWRVPHFEKMLYDQAQLANVYLSAWWWTREPRWREVARGTLAYVQQRLLRPEGGFYAAEDAESLEPARRNSAEASGEPPPKSEGAYYLWTWEQLVAALGADDAAWLAPKMGAEPSGNIAAAIAPALAGRNLLYRLQPACEAADEARASVLLDKLRAARAQRSPPMRDETIITAWNGMMISAFARAALALDEPGMADVAVQAAHFLRRELVDPQTGRLARSYRQGQRVGTAFAEDYAFLINGLIDLYQATHDLQWLDWADGLQGEQDGLFADPAGGGYFATTAEDRSVVIRLKEANDGAEPSGNSVSVRNLARLSVLWHDEARMAQARATLTAFGSVLERTPAAMPALLAAAGWLNEPPRQVVIQGERDDAETQALLAETSRHFRPRHLVMVVDRTWRATIERRLAFVSRFPEIPTQTALAYLCENYACQLPTPDPKVLARLLGPPAATRP